MRILSILCGIFSVHSSYSLAGTQLLFPVSLTATISSYFLFLASLLRCSKVNTFHSRASHPSPPRTQDIHYPHALPALWSLMLIQSQKHFLFFLLRLKATALSFPSLYWQVYSFLLNLKLVKTAKRTEAYI